MNAVAVVGPEDAGRTRVVETLVERLGERGRVGRIRHDRADLDTEVASEGRTQPAVTYRLGGQEWSATGTDCSLTDALDRLAEECAYAVVDGESRSRLPTVALAGSEHSGRTLIETPNADALDVDGLLDSIADAEEYVTLGSLVAEIKRSPTADRAGAIATFTGRVRARDDGGDPRTESLEFERYEGVARDRLNAIRRDLLGRDGVHEVLAHHRTGVIEAGEDIVFVVVLAGHREEAFRAVSDGIDRLKAEVPIFKKEVTTEDAFWVHERA